MARMNSMFKSPLYSNLNRPTNNLLSPTSQSPSNKPKSISIPVKFVNSSEIVTSVDPLVAATKIQKFIRGFLVRKNLKTVKQIEEEVNGIELKYKRGEEMDRIVRDEKERMKIGEMLMRFLFRLDSVRGVRDYRKKVIKRIISIQEMLDSVADKNPETEVEEIKSVITEEVNAYDGQANAMNENENTVESFDQNAKTGETECAESNAMNENENAVESFDQNAKTGETECARSNEDENMLETNYTKDESNYLYAVDEDMKMADSFEANENNEDTEEQNVIADEFNACDNNMHESSGTGDVVECMDQNVEKFGIVNIDESKDLYVVDEDLKVVASPEATECNANEKQILGNDEIIVENENENKNEKRKIENEGDGEILKMKDNYVFEKVGMDDGNDNKKQKVVEDENVKLKTENDKMKTIMENMMVENGKLKALVAELCARSAEQCKLMGGIAERVENLEKAVKKMKKKKDKKK